MKKIVLTGGGTAGHVTPNIALIPELQKEQTDYLMDASDGFVLNEMLLGLIENKRFRKIGKIYTFPMEDSEHVYFQNIIDESGNKRNFKCSNVGFRYEER